MNKRKAGWRILVAVLAVLAAVTVVIVVWRALKSDAEVNRADVAAVALAAIALATPVAIWALRSTSTIATAVVDVAAAAAQVLAGLVERQWRTEARHRLLDDPEPIPVHWQLIADGTVMSQPRLITAKAQLTFTGRSDEIADLAHTFRSLKRRRLVITGGAGMGKTTLAVQLLLQLLTTRTADQTAGGEGEIVPVPVLLPVSGWDTGAHPRLQDWLAVRLVQDYPALAAPQLGPGAAAALVEGGHVLPVLDGLDEIPAPARAQVIAALNASLTARDQLIITSRRAEFTTAVRETGRPLTAAAVIVPKPVTPQAAADYLIACLPASPSDAWAQILAALRSGAVPGLTRLAATPLGLWLIRTVYLASGADPAPLTSPLGDDADALRTHLLDRLIPALIQARPPSTDPADHVRPRHQLNPNTTRRHLTYLARAFPPATTRDIAWWRIAGTVPRLRLIRALALGLTAGVVLMASLRAGLTAELQAAIVFGLADGVVIGLIAGRDWTNQGPGYADVRLNGRALPLVRSIRSNLPFGLAFGLLGGIGAGVGLLWVGLGVLGRVGLGLLVGLGVALVSWLTFGLVFGLVKWVEQPTLASSSTPRTSWRADRALTLVRTLAFGLSFALAFGFLFALVSWLADGVWAWLPMFFLTGVKVGLSLGLVIGLACGLVLGNHHAWLACVFAVARLSVRRQLPWRIMDFLDDAHRLGLLRAVGPIYQFRHAALHDHLATATRPVRVP
ncbi:NACHT domain-containing protein [Nonomuraea sp. NPDC049784]|uniref:NACHT domain-containing protein n=1 Tax=Nonomuraea sp. NPDC049784 TaxID=3154361 RepID=UPI00340D1C95